MFTSKILTSYNYLYRLHELKNNKGQFRLAKGLINNEPKWRLIKIRSGPALTNGASSRLQLTLNSHVFLER